jgi:peroxiredoxin
MKGVAKTLAEIKPTSATEAIRLATMANSYVPTAFTSADKETAMKILSTGEALVPKNVTEERLKASADKAAADLAATRKTIDENPGKEAEVLQKQRTDALKAILAQRADPQAQAKAREERDAKLKEYVGKAAPEFKANQTLGEFKSMADLKGKVVLLDFFAHWCPPCKAAFPSMRTMYDDLKGKGLEIVGVTRYYGYYAKEKGLNSEAEYGKMKEFIVDHKINWPIAFVSDDVFKAYGVSPIPHAVVIDRNGNIQKVKIGFSEKDVESNEEFHKLIKKLLEG